MEGHRNGSESPEATPRKIKPIPATKLQAFSVGTHRKSRFQKHKEEIELRKKKESEEAAKVYAEFVASFEDPQEYKLGTSSFVKSTTLVPKGAVIENEAPKMDPASASSSKPAAHKPVQFVKSGEKPKPVLPTRRQQQVEQEDEEDDEDDMLAQKEARAQKKRNLDTFLEEIKKEQEDREDRLRAKHARTSGDVSVPGRSDTVPGLTLKAAFEERSGSHDVGDPMTTNLYVGNISPVVDEVMLCQEFAKYGPIASVKIMWPRTQEERDRNRNCGFVSFMKRQDAEQALKNLDGKMFHDHVMKVGWGKAVPLPPKPVFVLEKGAKTGVTGLPFNAQIVDTGAGVNSKPRVQVTVVKPTNMQQVKIIHRMVERVAVYGPVFEEMIMDRERDNPKFKFLFDNKSEEHIYYRWRLYSILQGDTKSQWRTEPFQMFEGGAWWVPPDVPFDDEGMTDVLLDSDDEEKERSMEAIPKGVLGKVAKQRFEIMLRQVTFQRGTIARAMAFAIDHADAADEVIDIIIKSLLIPETPLPTKLARLYLVSDILHNSGAHVANAWKYRVGFENRLDAVFEQFNEIYRSIAARLKAEQVRVSYEYIKFAAWENWLVFPQHHIQHLNDIFMRKPGRPTSASQSPTSDSAEAEDSFAPDIDSSTASKEQGSNTKDEDVDGEPMEDAIDGEPMNDDIDGEPMNDDIDGEPLEEGEPAEAERDMEDTKVHEIQDIFAEPS